MSFDSTLSGRDILVHVTSTDVFQEVDTAFWIHFAHLMSLATHLAHTNDYKSRGLAHRQRLL